jgi:plasmid stabilization system protein ParE
VTRSVHRLAEDDLAEAFRFYKREAGPGVARRFLDEFERMVALLETLPGIGTPTSEGRRVIPLADFPYLIIYRATERDVRILVVRHQSRDPEYGESRT